jgi:uncharacterized repeat protein (TIGR01451 family)
LVGASPSADLAVTKTVVLAASGASAGAVAPGSVVEYRLAFTNEGPSTAKGVVLTDLVPPQLLAPVVTYSSPEVLGARPGQTFVWDIADLSVGEGGEIRFVAQVDPEAELDTLLNEAEVTGSMTDPLPGNNRDGACLEVTAPDLFVVKSGPASAEPGQTVKYTIVWGNLERVAVPGAHLTDRLPAGTTYVDDDSGLTLTQPAAGVLAWTVPPGDLDSIASDVFELTVRIAEEPPGFSLINQVEIAYLGPDVDLSNNLNQWTVHLPASGWFTFLPIVLK